MELFDVDIHHGGKFLEKPILHYLGGKVTKNNNQDSDKMSYFEAKGLVEELGYCGSFKLYYRDPSVQFSAGIRCFGDDSCILHLLGCAKKTGCLDLYVDHCEQVEVGEASNLDLSNQGWLNRAEVVDISVPTEKKLGDGLVTQDDVVGADIHGGFTELLCRLVENFKTNDVPETEVGYESDESEAASLEHVSDDEELVDVRKKKLSLKEKKKKTNPTVEVENVFNECGSLDGLGFNLPPSNNEGDDSDSLYLDGSDYDSPVFSSDEDEQSTKNPRLVFPIWNPKTEMSKSIPELGTRFCSPKDLKLCITNYSISNGFPIKFDRNDHRRLLAHCAEGCKWRLYATWMQEERSFQLKSLKSEHSCVRAFNLPLVNASWLANKFNSKIQMNPKWKLRDMVQEVKEKFNIDVSISQCFRAKQKALGEVEKSLIEHYSRVWDYGAHLLKTNEGSTVKIMVDRPTPDAPTYFHRIYICLNAIRKGWLQGCRPIIGLDGCFLKGYVKGELLTAVGRDGNNQMFPIAWAVVEVENKDSWSWFIQLLKADLGVTNSGGSGLTLITDQQKGLLPAIAELLPNVEHRCCARHIYANMRKRYTAAVLKSLFWEAAKSGTVEEFQAVMADLCGHNQGAYEYLMQQNPTTWSRAFFSFHSKCEAVENNMCETLNGTIIEARYKPLIYMLEDIRVAAMSRMAKKRETISKWDQMFTPKAAERLEQAKKDHRFWKTTYNGENDFEVKNGDMGYVVNIQKYCCTCRMWSLSGIPCPHAISAIFYMKDDPTKYVSNCYKVDVIKEAYSNCIKGVDGQNMWPRTGFQPMFPPPARRMPGRPKKARRKDEHEKLDPKKKKVSKRGTTIQCNNCLQYGHNKRSCKGPSVAAENVKSNQKRKTRNGEGTSTGSRRMPGVKDKVPNGLGLYISPDSGNTYIREAGQVLPININVQIPQNRVGLRRNKQLQPHQMMLPEHPLQK